MNRSEFYNSCFKKYTNRVKHLRFSWIILVSSILIIIIELYLVNNYDMFDFPKGVSEYMRMHQIQNFYIEDFLESANNELNGVTIIGLLFIYYTYMLFLNVVIPFSILFVYVSHIRMAWYKGRTEYIYLMLCFLSANSAKINSMKFRDRNRIFRFKKNDLKRLHKLISPFYNGYYNNSNYSWYRHSNKLTKGTIQILVSLRYFERNSRFVLKNKLYVQEFKNSIECLSDFIYWITQEEMREKDAVGGKIKCTIFRHVNCTNPCHKVHHFAS